MPPITAKESSSVSLKSEAAPADDAEITRQPHSLAEAPAAPAKAALKSYNADVPAWGGVRYFGLFGCLLALLLVTGCADFTMTNPPRTVTEQLLLSTAADKAIRNTDLDMFRGKRVFIDGTYFDSYDPKYVLGAIRDAFSQSGALLAADVSNSDIIVEARSGAYSIDFDSSLWGIPTLGVPIPLAGTVSIPELALYKTTHQHSIAKFALLAYESKSREHFYSSGPMVGKSYNNTHKILGVLWVRTDIPEKCKKKSQ